MMLGLSLSTSSMAVLNGGGGAPAAPSTFTMTQLASARRIYQRSTTTGGAGNGAGSIAVTVNVTVAGNVYARVRDADGSTILQASWLAIANIAQGATVATIPNVNARAAWFFLDLSSDGVTWKLGTTLVGMGRVIGLSGQSQAVRTLGYMAPATQTITQLGLGIPAFGAVYARYTDGARTVNTPAWALVASSSNYDSAFLAEFLNNEISNSGVNCAVVGHAVGSTKVADWAVAGANYNDLVAVLDAVGGFEAFYWHLGGTDAQDGTTYADFKSGVEAIFTGLESHNAVLGGAFARVMTATATRLLNGDTTANVQNIRRAMKDAAAGMTLGFYSEPHDVIVGDNVHQTELGNVRLARATHRAFNAKRASLSAAGPVIASAVRATSSADVVLTVTLPAGATTLAAIGSPAERFIVYPAGATPVAAGTGSLPISSIAVGTSTITLTLSSTPSNAQALDVYVFNFPDPSGANAAANDVRDDYTADGIAVGRQIEPTTSAAITAPAPGGAPSAPFVDTFTEADATNLSAHTSDSGHTWAAASGTMLIEDGTGVYCTVPSSTYRSSYAPASADQYAEASWTRQTAVAGVSNWLLLRSTGTTTFYQGGWQQAGASGAGWYIGKTVAGTFTAISGAFSADSFPAASSRVVRFEVAGTTLKLIVDGVEVISTTDASIAAAGVVGLRKGGTADTITTGIKIDNMSAGV